MIRRWMLSLIITALPACLAAQNRGMSGGVHTGFGQSAGTSVRGVRSHVVGPRIQRPYRNNALIFGDPYLYDYADYPTEASPEPAPQIIVTHAAQPVVTPEPLMLEWQNDRWVRVSAAGDTVPSKSTPELRAQHASPQTPPPSAVLVFTDGHTQEVNRYMIVGKVMYANSDYWKTGAWTQKILLSSLDIPASLRANQERGAKLVLPGGPNEVVIGP